MLLHTLYYVLQLSDGVCAVHSSHTTHTTLSSDRSALLRPVILIQFFFFSSFLDSLPSPQRSERFLRSPPRSLCRPPCHVLCADLSESCRERFLGTSAAPRVVLMMRPVARRSRPVSSRREKQTARIKVSFETRSSNREEGTDGSSHLQPREGAFV